MDVLNAELVHRLARTRDTGRPVISMFLNVDGRSNIRAEDYLSHLDALIRDASGSLQPEECASDLQRIRNYVATEFSRGSNRGLAIFASGEDLWEVIPLPLPVDNHLTINSTPHVAALEFLLNENESVGVLLTDKQRARLLVIELGNIVERRELFDPLPRHDDDKGDWRKDHVKAHSNATASQHVKRAADEMFELLKEHKFTHLVLSCADDVKTELEKSLHSYLQSRLIGRVSIPLASSDDEVLANARDLVAQHERVTEAAFVERMRAGLGDSTNGTAESASAVAGLDQTLQAIFDRRVETLLVSQGYVAEGWRCHSCNYITTLGRSCAICNSEMTLVDNVVEEAIQDALAQNCHVEFCVENADLDVMGRIGALLRF